MRARRPLQERLAADVADRYELLRELGRGACAVVYLARDRKHGREVAVKVLDPVTAPASGAARFHQEIAFLARLQHPHILPLHDSGEAAGSLYFVAPYVSGETLRARLKRGGPLAPAVALRLAGEIAGALAHAHAAGVMHRDVKPENVLLTGGADDPHAVVCDFGIARLVEPAESGGALGRGPRTESGHAMGTLAYMAPEQARCDRDVDARADVWALGLVLHEMLAGHLPHADEPTTALALLRRYAGPPPRLSLPGTPRRAQRRLDALLARALAPDRQARFADGRELAASVAEVQGALAAPGAIGAAIARWDALAAHAAVAVGLGARTGGQRSARPPR